MDRKVSDLSVTEFKHLVKEIIHDELEHFDHDDGLELRDEVKEELRKYNKEKNSGNLETLDAEEVFK